MANARVYMQLFDLLGAGGGEYSVRVSYLEIYNEELYDLLSGNDDQQKLKLYEDVARKGCNFVQGLEEIVVRNKVWWSRVFSFYLFACKANNLLRRTRYTTLLPRAQRNAALVKQR